MRAPAARWGAAWVVAMVAIEAQSAEPKPAPAPAAEVVPLREAAVAAIARARARVATGSEILREVTLPSIERLLEDADLRRASITAPARDWDFVRRTLETARAYADRVVAGEDPYRSATGEMVKAYRADWDGTLQPYALYVPRGYDPRKPLAAGGRAARRAVRPPAQPAPGVRSRQPSRRDRRGGVAQRAAAPRRAGAGGRAPTAAAS